MCASRSVRAEEGKAAHGLPGSSSGPVRIDGENYRLCSLGPNSAGQQLQDWFGDDDILKGLNLQKAKWTIDRLKSFLAAYDNRARYFLGIYAKDPERLIGFCTLDVNLMHKRGTLNAALGDRAYWGRNVLQEAIGNLTRYMFEHRDIEKISTGLLATNRKGLFNVMRAGSFKFEARLRQEVLTPEGKRVDVLTFAVYRTPQPANSGPAPGRRE
jgi:RimJ/RimL family protein N-acetyltransferase